MIRGTIYALNTGLQANPTRPSEYIYADPGRFSIYIFGEPMNGTSIGEYRKVKAVSCYGSLGYHISEMVDIQRQSGMGNTGMDYGQMVIGIIDIDGTTHGTIPSRKIPYYVAK